MSRLALFHPALFRLELRRGLRAGLPLLALVVAVLCASGGPELREGSEGIGSSVDAGALARGLTRLWLWSAVLLTALPLWVLRAAGTPARWRAGEGDWLGSRPTGRLAAWTSTWLGATAAGALALFAAALAVELRTSGDGPSLAYLGSHDLSDVRRVEPGETRAFTAPEWTRWDGPGRDMGDAAGEARVRVRIRLAPADFAPRATVLVELARESGESSTVTRALAARERVELELPPGAGVPTLRVTNVGSAPLAILTPQSFEFWAPGASERRASFELALRGSACLAAALALAIGYGTWLGAPLAALATLATWVLVRVVAGGATGWLPGMRLARALAFVGEGRTPEPLDPRALAGLAACAALGALATVGGMRAWRSAT